MTVTKAFSFGLTQKHLSMIMKFLGLEWKSFFRSPQFGAGILMKLGMLVIYINLAAVFLGAAFVLFFYSRQEAHVHPLVMFSRFFLLYWVADLLMKYFGQQLPANNIKPLLTLNIPKSSIAGYTLGKILVSFFSWSFLLFIVPFSILLLAQGGESFAGVAAMFLTTFSLLFINTFINVFLNKSDRVMYTFFALLIAAAALHYFKVISIPGISQSIFLPLFTRSWLFVIPLVAMLVMGYFTYRFIRENLYLDRGLEMKTAAGRTENIAFLNRFGSMGTFINNDIRLIRRSKAARSALMGGFAFLFYGLLIKSQGYDASFMQVFLGIFVTGGFNFMFGQRVPAWDSSYYPLMMTQNVPYRDFLKAKWWLFVLVTFVSMILAVGYAFFSWEFYFTIFAAGLYNLGVNSYLTLLAGAFNKKPIDLNSTSKGFTGGQNNFNLKVMLLLIPQLVLPMAVFGGVKYLLGMSAAVISLAVLGLIGFLLRDRIFDQIVRIYRTEKYSTLAAFKKSE